MVCQPRRRDPSKGRLGMGQENLCPGETRRRFLHHGNSLYLEYQFYFGVLKSPNSSTDKVIDLLVGLGINVNTTDHTGQTPLHYVVRTAHFEAVRKLCQLGANPNQRAHWQGLTPLHLAAVVGSTNIINELLKAGGDPELKQSRGESARDLLSLFHKIEIPMFSRIKM